MNIREEINKRPGIVTIVLTLIIAAVAWAALRGAGAPPKPTVPDRLFYTDDDGKSFFADDAALIPPFDHNGRPAYVAMVFKCPGKEPFAGYLLRYNREGQAALKAFPESQRRTAEPNVLRIKQSSAEVKRPGDKRWLSPGSDVPTGDILRPECPGGDSSTPEPILPN